MTGDPGYGRLYPRTSETTVTPVTKWPMTRRKTPAFDRSRGGSHERSPGTRVGDRGAWTTQSGHDRHRPPAHAHRTRLDGRDGGPRRRAVRRIDPGGRPSASRSRASRCCCGSCRASLVGLACAAEIQMPSWASLVPPDGAAAYRPAAAASIADWATDDRPRSTFAQTGLGTSTNTNMYGGDRPPRDGAARRRSGGPTPTTTSTVARAPERTRSPDRAPALAAMAIEERNPCRPSSGRTPAWSPKEQEFWPVVKIGPDALSGRDPDPARTGVPQHRRPTDRGVAPTQAMPRGRLRGLSRLRGRRSGPGSDAHSRVCLPSLPPGFRRCTGLVVRRRPATFPCPGDA